MTIQDKYSRANSRRYRAAHGGIQSNRAKLRSAATNEFPALDQAANHASDSTPRPIENADVDADATEVGDHGEDGDDRHRQTYSRRTLKSNLDRYQEPEPDPDAGEKP